MTETIQVEWLTRAQGGLPPAPLGMQARPGHLIGTTVHHTATADNDPNPLATWARIYLEATSAALPSHDRYVDTPYNAGVTRLRPGVGAVLAGRPNNVVGAHARPLSGPPDFVNAPNWYTLGVALIGTNPTPEALAALKAYLYVANLGEKAPFIFPHSFWDPTACPGPGVVTFLVDLHSPYVHLVDR